MCTTRYLRVFQRFPHVCPETVLFIIRKLRNKAVSAGTKSHSERALWKALPRRTSVAARRLYPDNATACPAAQLLYLHGSCLQTDRWLRDGYRLWRSGSSPVPRLEELLGPIIAAAVASIVIHKRYIDDGFLNESFRVPSQPDAASLPCASL